LRNKNLWLVICRSGERSCVPRDVACPGDDEGRSAVPTRTTDCYEIKLLTSLDKQHACGCQQVEQQATGGSTPPHELQAAAAPAATLEPAAAPTPDQAKYAASSVPNLEAFSKPDYWDCHRAHYCGVCSCGCCGDDCVVLAKLVYKSPADGKPLTWTSDYSARRFIRPMLAPDPQREGDPMKCHT
jgi:hypothetical protein